MPTLAFTDHAVSHGTDRVRWPDDHVVIPVIVVHARPGFRCIERLVGIKFIDKQQKAIVGVTMSG